MKEVLVMMRCRVASIPWICLACEMESEPTFIVYFVCSRSLKRDNLILDLTTNSRCVGNSTMELSEDVFEQSLERAGIFFPDILCEHTNEK